MTHSGPESAPPGLARGKRDKSPCLTNSVGRSRQFSGLGIQRTKADRKEAVYLHASVDVTRHEYPPPWKGSCCDLSSTGSRATIGVSVNQHLFPRGRQVRAVVRNGLAGTFPD